MSQSPLIEGIEKEHLKEVPEFKVGDTVSVHMKIIEGEKQRIQVFTGIVIARKGKGLSETVSIYRVAYGSAMERVIPIHSPKVAKIEIVKRGKVRRGKLYHLRGVFGKKAKVEEQIVAREKKSAAIAPQTVSEKEQPVEEKKEE